MFPDTYERRDYIWGVSRIGNNYCRTNAKVDEKNNYGSERVKATAEYRNRLYDWQLIGKLKSEQTKLEIYLILIIDYTAIYIFFIENFK